MNLNPLLEGVTPTASSLAETREFIAVGPDDNVLTEKEWSDVIGDNVLYFGEQRHPISKYTLAELRIFHSPFSEEALALLKIKK